MRVVADGRMGSVRTILVDVGLDIIVDSTIEATRFRSGETGVWAIPQPDINRERIKDSRGMKNLLGSIIPDLN
jgi:hypothetical protein